MMKYAMFFFLLPFSLHGQVFEKFSDGDFTQDPVWTGDTADFRVSSSSAVPEEMHPALQLDALSGGVSYLSVNESFSGDLEWSFWLKLSLNTSSGNFARVYLLSDKDSLRRPLNGYFIQFGGADDSVDFYRQERDTLAHLARMRSLYTGNSTNAIRIRITRTAQGSWQFYGDPAGTSSMAPVGEVADLAVMEGEFFGISFQYTSSNASKFYFDDLYAGPLVVDTLPPSLLVASVVNPSEISLVFSEGISPESAEHESNYAMDEGIGQPYSAIRLLDPSLVRLFFDKELLNGKMYSLQLTNMTDLAGNTAGAISADVSYYKASPYDIIFTEIMCDPSPPAGLPEYEYLEIHNRCGASIDLAGWKLVVGNSIYELPGLTIYPGDYFLLCSIDAVGTMQTYGRAVGLGSFGLSNNGTSLRLLDPQGQGICFTGYEPSWYRDDTKSEGGYSLEMTDIANPCLDALNWRVSGHPDGGTPGTANFNYATLLAGLKIDGICCVNETLLEVSFSQAIDSLAASDSGIYSISPEGLSIISANALPPLFTHVSLQLGQPGTAGQIYELGVQPNLENCIGEPVGMLVSAGFGWQQECIPFDVVINEILFNPLGDGVDYVELLNRSDKAILLSELTLASARETPPNPPDTQYAALTRECRSILPGEYLVLTKNAETVKQQYMAKDPDAFLEMAYFPAFNNDEGNVLIFRDKEVIDGFRYRDDMHFLMLTSTEGVSLERICPDRFGDDAGNWHSAAETAGFGTPGYRNSQYLETWSDESVLSIHPQTFSPDGDGIDDQLGITYSFGEPGKLVSIMVFSYEGRLTRNLVNNEMPGTSGIFSWDGTMDDRSPALEGIYIVYMEALGMDGRTIHQRKACVLAKRR